MPGSVPGAAVIVRVVVNDVMVLFTLVLSWLSVAVRPGGVVAVMLRVRVNPLVVRVRKVDWD